MKIRSFACNAGAVPHLVEVAHDDTVGTVFIEMRPKSAPRRATGEVKRSVPKATGGAAYTFFSDLVRKLTVVQPSTTKRTPRGS